MTVIFQTFETTSVPFEITSFSDEDVGGNRLDGIALVIQTGTSYGFLIGRRPGSENAFYERAIQSQRRIPTDDVWKAMKASSIADVTDEPIDRAFDDLYDTQVLRRLQSVFPTAVADLLRFMAPSEAAAARRCAFAHDFPMLVHFMDQAVLRAIDNDEPPLDALNVAIARELSCPAGVALTQAHIDRLRLVEWKDDRYAREAVSLIARLDPTQVPLTLDDGACAITLGMSINSISRNLAKWRHPEADAWVGTVSDQLSRTIDGDWPSLRKRMSDLAQMPIGETECYHFESVVFDPMFEVCEVILTRLFPGVREGHLLPSAFRMLYGTESDLADAFRIGNGWNPGVRDYVVAHRSWRPAFRDFKCDETDLIVSVLTDTEQLRAAGDATEDAQGFPGLGREFVRTAEFTGYANTVPVSIRKLRPDGTAGKRRGVATLSRDPFVPAGFRMMWLVSAKGSPVDPQARLALSNCLKALADGSLPVDRRAFDANVAVTPYEVDRVFDIWRPRLQPSVRDLSVDELRKWLEIELKAVV